MSEIKIWAQMFFEDGSVSQGTRIPVEWLDEGNEERIELATLRLLHSVNREEGWLLLWGAGNMVFKHFPTSFSKNDPSESDSSASPL